MSGLLSIVWVGRAGARTGIFPDDAAKRVMNVLGKRFGLVGSFRARREIFISYARNDTGMAAAKQRLMAEYIKTLRAMPPHRLSEQTLRVLEWDGIKVP